jgi:4'-phosphopantetheinyl transferase
MAGVDLPLDLALTDRVVQVCCVDLDQWQSQMDALRALLSQDERDRADRFYFERDRVRFVLCRGILRRLLAHHLQIPPNRVQFAYNAYGKPGLAGDNPAQTLCFNVSHSQQTALFAMTLNRSVGVDLEYVRPVEVLQLADRFFSEAETQWLRSLPAPEQPTAFFQLWTAKEAYLKAIGTGLSQLAQIEINFAAEPPQLIDRSTQKPLTNWTIQPLQSDLTCVAHLAIEVQNPIIHFTQC